MNEIKWHSFTLILNGVNEKTDGLEDAIFQAGCDDALINYRDNAVFLDFDRESSSFEKAVISAIKDVESTPLNIKVTSIAPDDYVSESEIAKRLNLKRQTISLWVKGNRRSKQPFPTPVMKLTEKSPLWRWYEVAKWLHLQKKIEDNEVVNNARFIENANLALLERYTDNMKYCHELIRKLA